MIWILLAALGIPIWLVLGALGATLLSRRSFKRRPGVFPAKLRVVSGEVAMLKDSWPRRLGYAWWVHDVLLVQHGVALVRTEAYPVAGLSASSTSEDTGEIRGLGDAPLLMTLELDSGSSIELAAPADVRHIAVGLFRALTDPSV
jgi:hypothetical protein